MSDISSSKQLARERLNLAYEETHRTIADTLRTGRDTLNELRAQEEALQSSEDTLEASDYTLERSLKILRGMTWSGMMYNAFTLQSGNDSVANQIRKDKSDNSNEKSKNPNDISKQALFNVDALDHFSHDEKQVIMLSKAVDELHSIAVSTGQAIDSQNSTIERIQEKTDIVLDKTLEATLKSARITSRRARSDFVGRFQFIDLTTSYYLSIREDCLLCLSNKNDRSTMFDIFIKEDNILGIQSIKTILFLGVTLLGSVKVSGEYFGRYEECYFNLGGNPTGLLLLSKNWGGGGWLKRPREGDFTLSDTTTSIYDKQDILIFHVQPIPIQNKSENN